MVDSNVVGVGTELLRYLSLSGLFITMAFVYTGGLQGAGDTRSPLRLGYTLATRWRQVFPHCPPFESTINVV
jgi:Na+-driven multidrug efflux pump